MEQGILDRARRSPSTFIFESTVWKKLFELSVIASLVFLTSEYREYGSLSLGVRQIGLERLRIEVNWTIFVVLNSFCCTLQQEEERKRRLREQASKLLQQAKNRHSDLSKKRQSFNDEPAADANSLSHQTVEATDQRKNSLPTNFKATPFKLVKAKQLRELSPRHFLKEKKPSVDSCMIFVVVFCLVFITRSVLSLIQCSTFSVSPSRSYLLSC